MIAAESDCPRTFLSFFLLLASKMRVPPELLLTCLPGCPSTHPAGLSPLHRPEKPDLTTVWPDLNTSCRNSPEKPDLTTVWPDLNTSCRNRPEKPDLTTVWPDLNTSCRNSQEKPDLTTVWPDLNTHPAGTDQRSQTWLQSDQTSTHILQEQPREARPDYSLTRPQHTSCRNRPEKPDLTTVWPDLNTHPVGTAQRNQTWLQSDQTSTHILQEQPREARPDYSLTRPQHILQEQTREARPDYSLTRPQHNPAWLSPLHR